MRGKVDAQDSMRRRWMSPKEDDGRRWKWKREKAFWPDSELTEWQNETWMCEGKKKLMEWSKKARDCKWKSAVRWKWYGESNGRTGWSLSPLVSPPVSLPRSLSLSHREADTSLHPFDRSQKGGWIEEWRGVKERDERRRKGPKRGWAADGHLNARLPIFWKNERAEADTQTKTGMRAVCTKCSNTFAGSWHPCVQTWVWKRGGGCSETLLLLAL